MFNVNVGLLLVADHPQDGDIYILVDKNKQIPTVPLKTETDDIAALASSLYTQVTTYSPVWGGLRFKSFTKDDDTLNLFYHSKLSLMDQIPNYTWTSAKELTDASFPIKGLR
jgi:hypothetical protein